MLEEKEIKERVIEKEREPKRDSERDREIAGAKKERHKRARANHQRN